MKDKQLIEDILSGNQKKFRLLVDKYKRLVFHVIFRLIRNNLDVEEVAQEVFIKIYKNLDSFRYQSKLSTWIGRIAYNTAINFLDKKRIPLVDDVSPEYFTIGDVESKEKSPQQLTENNDSAIHLKKQISYLPARYQVILTMYHIEELTYSEISEIMNMPEGTVKNYLFRARKILKERLLIEYSSEDL